MEQRGAVGGGQFVEQHRELATHAGIADEGAVGLLHHRPRLFCAAEGNIGDVGARCGAANDVDVGVAGAVRQGIGGAGYFAWGAQVVHIADTQAIEGSQVGGGRGKGIGAVEHARPHCAVMAGGVGTGGAGDVAEIVHAGQARGVERFGSVGGGNGKGEQGQGAEHTLQHGSGLWQWVGLPTVLEQYETECYRLR
ncbi:hypothetical protein D3C80_1192460 [compost metagenome]